MPGTLGITESIIAIIDFSAKVIDYAQAVKNVNTDQQKLICELQLLKNIVERLHRRDIKADWEKVNPLVQPIKELEELLEGLASHVPANANATGSRLVWPFKHRQIEATLSAIERYKSCILLVLDDHQTEMIYNVQQELSTLNSKLDPRALKSGCGNSPHGCMQADIFSKRTENTGTWMFESTEFKHWIAGDMKTLLATGIPGAGKSVLASVIVDYLEKTLKDKNTAVCYVYCNYKQQGEQPAFNLISSLLRQLATEHETTQIQEAILKVHRDSKAKEAPLTFSDCKALLVRLIPYFKRVFIVIDALDECRVEERTKLVTEITKISASVIVMSREIPDILELFPGVPRIPVRASEKDVDRYLTSEIETNPSLLRLIRAEPTLQEDIIDQIRERSQGMFLLVHLHMKAVARHLTAGGVRAELQNLPKDDVEAYDKAMRLIAKQEPLMSDLGIKVLTWIIYATRPLSLLELQHAVASNASTSHNEDLASKETMISACLGLVIYEEIGCRLRLVHYTAQEYFQRKGQSLLPADPHSALVVTCINHLMMPGKGGLYDYAVTSWAAHGRASCSTSGEAMRSIKGMLGRKYRICQLLNGLKHPVSQYHSTWAEQDCTILILSALFGLTHMVDAELQRDHNSGRHKDQYGISILSLAAMGGHVEVVRLLLKRKGLNISSNQNGTLGVHVHQSSFVPQILAWMARQAGEVLGIGQSAFLNQKDKEGRCALHWSVQGGHTEVVSVLLQAGADYNIHNEYGDTPLQAAAHSGNDKIVDLLLQAGADCNIQNKHGRTPLDMAANSGNDKVVELLLQAGADYNIQNSYGSTPLDTAAHSGNDRIVELLLQAGAHCNVNNSNGCTVLYGAAFYGHERIVELLLQAGADYNSSDGSGSTPLHGACKDFNGEEKVGIVQKLIEAGAYCNKPNLGGYYPLDIALEGGKKKFVELLLKAGAICRYRTPLNHPAYADVMRKLAEAGTCEPGAET